MSDFLRPQDERDAPDEEEHLRDDVPEKAKEKVSFGRDEGEPGLGRESQLGLTPPD